MYLLSYDKDTGKILGWFKSSINKNIPKDVIEIEEFIWETVISNNYNHYNDITKQFSLKDLRSDYELIESEWYWAVSELNNSDIEINKLNSCDRRAIGTLECWYLYQNSLRDYVTTQDSDSGITYTLNDLTNVTYNINGTIYTALVDTETNRPIAPK